MLLFPSKEFSLIRENVERASKATAAAAAAAAPKDNANNNGDHASGGVKTDPELNPMLQRSVLTPLFISLGLMFFQQWSGVNAVIFYTVSIFDAADSAIEKNLATVIVGITQFLATFGN